MLNSLVERALTIHAVKVLHDVYDWRLIGQEEEELSYGRENARARRFQESAGKRRD